jgi:hypothetical protein
MNDSPLGHWALTVSRPSADVTLITLRVADLAAALPWDKARLGASGWASKKVAFFAHPAGYSDADQARELIAAYCAAIEFFRSLL